MHGSQALRQAIDSVPVPEAPPRLSIDDGAVGLGFLDAALRLNHVRRLTERLTLVRHRSAERRVELDINLRMLSDVQREAGERFRHAMSQGAESPSADRRDALLWVPVARVSRRNTAPVEVYDRAGARLPRLTQYETSRLVACGLYRLLRGILVSHPDARDPERPLYRLLYQRHEPRWLIASALLAVLGERGTPPGPGDGPQPLATSFGRAQRVAALEILDVYGSLLDDYYKLLNVAVNDYLVVVALDARTDEHLLSYNAPLHADTRDGRLAFAWRIARASHEGYYVRYKTEIPSTLRSYHLVVDAAPGVDIEGLYLTTDADERRVEELRTDLAVVADRIDTDVARTAGGRRLIELELGTAVGRLSELLRRRAWEADRAGLQAQSGGLAECRALVATAGDDLVAKVTADRLRAAAAELAEQGLRYDISAERQPSSNHTHVYWRTPEAGLRDSRNVTIRAGMMLHNTAETSVRLVLVYAAVLAAIGYLVSAFLAGGPWPYGAMADRVFTASGATAKANAGAIVGLLLLVPGFLYTRLSLPERHSIAWHLRFVPRLVVYACIASMVPLAIAVGVERPGWMIRVVFAVASGGPLASMVLLMRRRGRVGADRILARLKAPRWVTGGGRRAIRPVEANARYAPSGSNHE